MTNRLSRFEVEPVLTCSLEIIGTVLERDGETGGFNVPVSLQALQVQNPEYTSGAVDGCIAGVESRKKSPIHAVACLGCSNVVFVNNSTTDC